ncbi:exopolyphosphatase [Prevotella sp. TCVGH]|uniref:Ppx/GppA phosphatase family protein n=1 Tax=Prevotella sp. TCVGH TaxID=2182433 RepID=UPI00201E100F|nr:Ppx/GppA family phosphatase [Prevotella sp. TCVGH]MCL6747275.1 exopolyphosphatase [Prevotella sp. TCVGH]
MKAKTYAAIDIGSNGARLLIKRFDDNAPEFDRIKRVLFIRVPLRLGKDVFTLGKISKEREVMMMHMMKGFKHFMLLNQVDDYRACATAAMRDAENGKKIMKSIMQETGIKLEIIRGEEEARLLCNNVIEQTNSNSGSYAYVDVGGGSTEISLLHDGVLAESHSFDIGTLRMLSGKVTNATKYQMRGMLDMYAEEFPGAQIIGSGGNINKLFKLTHNKNDEKVIKVSELKEIYQELAQLNEEERKEKYGLKDDRVDVIIPAAEIFLMVASGLKCDAIYVPNISLADSIVDGMYRSQLKKQG